MQLQTVNRSDAEKIYGNFTNAEGATCTTGYAVCFTTTVASVDGNLAVLPATNNIRTFAGICDSDVADNAVGRYQAYGYAGSIWQNAAATSLSYAADTAMGPVAGSSGLDPAGTSFALGPVIAVASATAVIRSVGAYVAGIIRAL